MGLTLASKRRRDEQGAVAFVVTAALTLLLIMAAFAVDLGSQRVLKRDLQAVADVISLDMTRQLDGRTHAVIKATSDWRNQLRSSVARNLGIPEASITAQQQQENAVATVSGTPTVITATMGFLDDAGEFEAVPYPAVPTAVRVVVTSKVDFGFAQVIGVSEGGAVAAAVATHSTPTVCFSVGTRTLVLNTAESGLSPLLEKVLAVNLSAVGHSGLADLKNVSVPLVGLLAKLNVGSVDALATTNVTLGGMVVALADVLRAEGETAAVDVLEALSINVPGLTFALGKILALESGADVAGLVADVNVLDLLGAAVLAANGSNGVDLSVPGIAGVTITEPPQIACGGPGTTARSAQIRINVDTSVPPDPVLGIAGADLDLPIEVGRGSATVRAAMKCDPEEVPLTVTTGAVSVLPNNSGHGQLVVRVSLATVNRLLEAADPLGVVRLALAALGLDEITVDGSVTASVAPSSATPTVTYPAAPAMPETVRVPDTGVASVLVLNAPPSVQLTPGQNAGVANALGVLLNPLLSDILGTVVTPLVNNLNPVLAAILNPVLDLLGIKLGVTEVDMMTRPHCNTVRLTG